MQSTIKKIPRVGKGIGKEDRGFNILAKNKLVVGRGREIETATMYLHYR
jgi:hypothetical protein